MSGKKRLRNEFGTAIIATSVDIEHKMAYWQYKRASAWADASLSDMGKGFCLKYRQKEKNERKS